MRWYPLTFHPIFQERIWGGRALAELFGKPLPPEAPVGESWEISDRPDAVSRVANGPWAGWDLHTLLQIHAREILGRAPAPAGRFPLLVKILDAREVLSVQVHPPPAVAARLGGEPKTELWYVAHAGPEAEVFAGLKAGVTREEFERRLRTGAVAECLHRLPVRPGDALFVPSGRVHALGAPLVIFEIQQNSDTTYRVFDWNRTGPDGRPRKLHRAEALASIDFADYEPGLVNSPWQRDGPAQSRVLADDPLFQVTEYRSPGPGQWRWTEDRAGVVGVVSGELRLIPEAGGESPSLKPGAFALLPPAAAPVRLETDGPATWLLAHPG